MRGLKLRNMGTLLRQNKGNKVLDTSFSCMKHHQQQLGRKGTSRSFWSTGFPETPKPALGYRTPRDSSLFRREGGDRGGQAAVRGRATR